MYYYKKTLSTTSFLLPSFPSIRRLDWMIDSEIITIDWSVTDFDMESPRSNKSTESPRSYQIDDEETGLLTRGERYYLRRQRWVRANPWKNRLEWAGIIFMPVAACLGVYCLYLWCENSPEGAPRCAGPSLTELWKIPAVQ